MEASVVRSILWAGMVLLTAGPASTASPINVELRAVSSTGIGEPVGKVDVNETEDGLAFEVTTWSISAGEHGFHVHETGSCDPKSKDGVPEAAGSAGPHFDPHKSGRHRGPGQGGHAGDLPRLTIAGEGEQRIAFVVPLLTLKEIRGRALIVHEGGDTYADVPPAGGGGKRIACGVIP